MAVFLKPSVLQFYFFSSVFTFPVTLRPPVQNFMSNPQPTSPEQAESNVPSGNLRAEPSGELAPRQPSEIKVDSAGEMTNGQSSKALTGELITSFGPNLAERDSREEPGGLSRPSAAPEPEWYQKKWVWAIAALGLLALPATYLVSQNIQATKAKEAAAVVATPPPKVNAVAALGRLEPDGEVIKLTASSSQTVLVRQILVKEGDKVVPNQVIAILDNVGTKQAQLAKANEEIKVAKTNLAKVKAGAKTGEVSAQRAEVTRLEASLRGQANISKATLDRLQQQLPADTIAQARRVEELRQDLAKGAATHQADLSRLSTIAERARSEYGRYRQLYNSGGAVSASVLDEKKVTLESALKDIEKAKAARRQVASVLQEQIQSNEATQSRITSNLVQQIKEAKATYDRDVATLNEQIKQAKANVDSVSEVRPVDISSAEAAVASAVASANQAQADLQLAFVRAPIAGEIFKIHTKPGEAPSSKGIAEIAQNDRMVAVAEIYESDIGKIKMGQVAEIKSETGSFKGILKGTVQQIGLQVAKKDVLNTDPAADADSRIVEVRLAIDPAENINIRGLTNSKVEIKIKTE
jgi:HlyD family secretion protein